MDPDRATLFIANPENSSTKPMVIKLYGFQKQGTMAVLDAHGKVSQEIRGGWARATLTVLGPAGIGTVRSL
jgi:hypothetical protein